MIEFTHIVSKTSKRGIVHLGFESDKSFKSLCGSIKAAHGNGIKSEKKVNCKGCLRRYEKTWGKKYIQKGVETSFSYFLAGRQISNVILDKESGGNIRLQFFDGSFCVIKALSNLEIIFGGQEKEQEVCDHHWEAKDAFSSISCKKCGAYLEEI